LLLLPQWKGNQACAASFGDTGGAFTVSALGSFAYFVKCLCNSPNVTRIAGGLEAMRLNV
jgi:hypothetical protein